MARITGEIDEFNLAAVEAELAVLGAEPVVVDLSALAFIGSAGVRVLFALAERVQRLVVVAPRGRAVPARARGRRARPRRAPSCVETLP